MNNVSDKRKSKLLNTRRLCFVASSGIDKVLENKNASREEWRAIRAIERGMRYLKAVEPEKARWDRGK